MEQKARDLCNMVILLSCVRRLVEKGEIDDIQAQEISNKIKSDALEAVRQ